MFYCTNCGKPYNEGTKFCGFCSASFSESENKSEINNMNTPVQISGPGGIRQSLPVEEPEYIGKTLTSDNHSKPERQPRQRKKSRIKYIITSAISIALTLIVLGLAGLLNFTKASSSGRIREVSFDQPEDAITYYVDHLKEGDLIGMLAACDINEKAANFDFNKNFDRLGSWSFYTLLPSEYETYADINKYLAANTLVNSIKNQYLALTASDNEAVKTLLEGMTVTELGDFEIEQIDPQEVSKLQLIRMDLTEPERQTLGTFSKSMKKSAEVYGGDNFREYAALYELNDTYYMAGFQLYHYESGWKISNLQSYISGINVLYPTTMSEYKNTINN